MWLAQRGERTMHIGVRKRAQHDGAGVPLGDELLESDRLLVQFMCWQGGVQEQVQGILEVSGRRQWRIVLQEDDDGHCPLLTSRQACCLDAGGIQEWPDPS